MVEPGRPLVRVLLFSLALPLGLGASCSSSSPAVDSTVAADSPGVDGAKAGDGALRDVAHRDAAKPREAALPDGAGPCPWLMVEVAASSTVTTFCIDLFEGALEEYSGGSWAAASPYKTVGTRTVRAVPAQGIVPQGYISGTEASAACVASGKRLCTSDEWLLACKGSKGYTYPYGNTHVDGACNDAYSDSPVVKYFGTSTGVWDSTHMNDPGINQMSGTVAKGGAYTGCVTSTGIYDLHGNLHEWVSDSAGTFRGGFYADAKINGPGCTYVTTAHTITYHDYSTGFRCCADPKGSSHPG
jgi:formylglycine-generating enzyme